MEDGQRRGLEGNVLNNGSNIILEMKKKKTSEKTLRVRVYQDNDLNTTGIRNSPTNVIDLLKAWRKGLITKRFFGL